MVTNVQYPHILKIKDENGEWKDASICCDQPNNKGEKQHLADGTFYQFRSIVFAPKDEITKSILLGQDLMVIGEKGEKRLVDEIKRISIDVFHVRVWI
jgi:hypothetical protein